jgi:septum formation protein
MTPPSVILASGSVTRQNMLRFAGVPFEVDRPDVDEGALKIECRARGLTIVETAEALALAKAKQIASRHPNRIVLGADQMLECGNEWFDKPVDRAAAGLQLMKLSGRSHKLHSATVALRDGQVIWRNVDTAELTMHPITPVFLEIYLDRVGDAVLSSVGCYQIEGMGIQLFSAINGSHFTIQGMALLPLLAFFRAEGVIGS